MIHSNKEGMVIIPPNKLTDEMLDQIRAVVCEELQVVFTEVQRTLQRMEQSRDISTGASSSDGTVTGTIVVNGKLTDLGKKLMEQANAELKRYAAPLPANTLRNTDGTPYSAGYDDKSFGQIAYEAYVENGSHRDRAHTQPWGLLFRVEQDIWEEVAKAVLAANETPST